MIGWITLNYPPEHLVIALIRILDLVCDTRVGPVTIWNRPMPIMEIMNS